MSQALFAKGNPAYDEVEASQWQATQVSTISIMNFFGRIIIGLWSLFVQYTALAHIPLCRPHL
jgi:hypothetical protein